MKILLLGANGQVGFELLRALAPLGELVAATREGVLVDDSHCTRADLGDAHSLRDALDSVRADIVVNAAAYTAVDRAEDEPELADRINHHAVGEIGAWAAANAARVVHYSTDYVFDGSSTYAYREDDATAPLGVYGRSKLAGEQALQASGAQHLIFRTAWVYAARGNNFLRTMLRLAGEREELRVVADQIGAPTPARWIADVTAKALGSWGVDKDGGTRRFAAASHPTSHPTVFNLVAGGRCSWFDFAGAIVDGAAKRGLIAKTPRMVAIATADFPTRARRPAWSVLDSTRLENAFGLQLADWRAGVDTVLDEVASLR